MTIDPLLKDLVEKHGGNVSSAARAAGIDKSSVRKMFRGVKKVTEDHEAKFRAALKLPVVVDGPKVAANVKKASKPNGHAPVAPLDPRLKKAPPIFKRLMEQHGNDMHRAAEYANMSRTYFNEMAMRKKEVSPGAKKRIQAALDGAPLPPAFVHPVVRVLKDKATQTAVIVAKTDNFEGLYDIAQTMGGEWAFKRKAGTHWVGVMRMVGAKMKGFLALAATQGAETYTT